MISSDEKKKTVTQNCCELGITAQKTLSDKVSLCGKGLHCGEKTQIIIHPSDKDTGIVLSDGNNRISATADKVIDVSRGTTIGDGITSFKTVEHLLSALKGMGIDNAFVEILGKETPALDGSAFPYVQAINEVGIVELDGNKKTIKLNKPVCVRKNDAFIMAVPSDTMRVTYVMDYDHPLIGSQTFTYQLNESDYAQQIAPARTFVLYEEVAGLLERHLAKGGDINNVIVLWQDKISSDLRFENELVRHKVLDFIGDVSLIGYTLEADVLAVKSGHALNTEFALEIYNMYKL